MRQSVFIIFSAFLLLSCASSKEIRFQKLPNDIYANSNLNDFFKTNKRPNIVLRVPNTNDKATSNTTNSKDNSVLYNAIEKELLKQGFSVRDRGLFNELLNKSQTTDYSKIKELTNTDVILEVVSIDPAIIYSTNKVTYVGKKREKEKIGTLDYKKYGASVEFRLIMVNNNEIAGTYKYNYQPCPDGCEINSFKFTGRRTSQAVLKETVSVNTLEEFIRSCTQDLIRSFKA